MNLTVLSFGGGQDSAALLWLYINDEDGFRAKYAPGDFVVVMADTGDEHDHTYDFVEKNTQALCEKHGIEFHFLKTADGYHTEAWPNIIEPQTRPEGGKFKPTMVQLGTKSCTDKVKITPIYKWLDEWINAKYSFDFPVAKSRGCLKRAIKKFGQDYGKIQVIIGYASGEEKRAKKSLAVEAKDHALEKDVWVKHIERRFPLIDMGMTRTACQKYIGQYGEVPFPSNCVMCPYMSAAELLWLHRNLPDKFELWCSIEDAKIARHAGVEKNYGVMSSGVLLRERLEKVKAKYAHMDDAELDAFLHEYKMNHGCGSSGY